MRAEVPLPAYLDSTKSVDVTLGLLLDADASVQPAGGAIDVASVDAYTGARITTFQVLDAAGAPLAGFTLTGARSIAEVVPPAPGVVRAVEFYIAAFGHFFISTNPAEIAALDGNPAWARTGESFKVMYGETMQSAARPVCRFYGRPSAGLDSHFFAASFAECVDVIDRWPLQWLLETTDAFAVVTEAPVSVCPADSQPLYRVYNQRADANHRYTTSAATRDAMVARGWVPEGSSLTSTSRDGVAMCVPQ